MVLDPRSVCRASFPLVVCCMAGVLALLAGLGCKTEPADPAAAVWLPAGRLSRTIQTISMLATSWGGAALEAGSHREALASFDRVLRADSSHAGSWSGTGQVLSLLGQEERAAAAFQRAISLDPDDVVAYRGLGLIALHQQRYAAAHQSYSRAVELAPEHAPSRYNLGVAYSKQSAYEEAVRQMRRAIELDGGIRPALRRPRQDILHQVGRLRRRGPTPAAGAGTRTRRALAANGTR